MMVLPLVFILEGLRDQLLKAGARGIAEIVKAKNKLDSDKHLNKEEFLNFLANAKLTINPEELAEVINTYESKCSKKHIRFLDFLWGLREKLNPFRQQLVVKAFKRLDQHQDGYATHDRLRELYNAKCHPAVMLERFDVHEVTEAFLAASFGNLERITLHDFLEYYALVSTTIKCDERFELLMMKHWKVTADGVDVDEIENKVKLVVYKHRIRSREFMRDFDKLRGRLITPTQFAAALDNSAVELTPREVKALCDKYRVPEDPDMRVCWTAFCDETDTVFTFKELDKTPWREPPPVPELRGLAPQRFEQGIVWLASEAREAQVEAVLQAVKVECRRRRVSLRGLFDDWASNRNSSKAVGHVTKQQFCQALSSKAGLRFSDGETALLADKFDDLRNGMVNYVAFATEVDPFTVPDHVHPRSRPPPPPPPSC